MIGRRLHMILILTALLFPGGRAVCAASPEARKAMSAKIGGLMPLIGQAKYDTLLQQVGMTSDPDHGEYDEVRRTLVDLSDWAGKYSDFEVVGYKSLGSRYETVYVMAYFQKAPVLFQFSFYSVGGDWQPLRLRVQASFRDVLDPMPLEKP